MEQEEIKTNTNPEKPIKQKDELISGALACEVFNLNKRVKFWLEKTGNIASKKTKKEWTAFLKKNFVID